MTTTLARNGDPSPAVSGPLDPAILERVMLDGDLLKLTPAQRIAWYRARCEAAGIDPRCQPFQYLVLEGKLTLYATKACTDNLAGLHRLKVELLEQSIKPELGIATVRCRVTFPDGRLSEDLGAVDITNLKGKALANALMRAITKAKRRTILSACGLGMLDESEVQDLDGPRYEPAPPPPSNDSGHGKLGAYASPADVASFEAATREFVAERNARFAQQAGLDGGDPRSELLRTFQVARHLLKFAVSHKLVNAPEEQHLKSSQVNKLVAVWFARDPQALGEEAERYYQEKAEERLVELLSASPAAEPDGADEWIREDEI